MAPGTFIAAALLGCLAIASANQIDGKSFQSLFSVGKAFEYSFKCEVKAGLLSPAKFDSAYVIKGIFYIVRYNSNTLFVTLQNVSIAHKNGRSADHENVTSYVPSPEAAKDMKNPYLLYYSKSGKLEAVQFSKQEMAWSKNIKYSWASILQLTLNNAALQSPEKFQAYIAPEKTSYGDCSTSYEVNSKYPGFNDTQTVVVTKFFSPSDCSKFNTQVFDFDDGKPDEMLLFNTASYKSYEIKKKNDTNFSLQKINSVEKFNFFAFDKKNDTYYIHSNATFNLKQVLSYGEVSLPTVDFMNSSLNYDWTYESPKVNYTEKAVPDVTNGRHIVNQKNVINKAQQLLINAANYIEENQNEANELNWQQGKIINKIIQTLSQANTSSLETIFNSFQNASSQIENAARSIWFGILPYVGSAASSSCVLNFVKNHLVTDFQAIEMLTKLSFNVREPSEDILAEMELLIDDDSLSPKVSKSLIFSFSTIVSKIYRNVTMNEKNNSLEKYLKMLYDRLINEPDYGYQLVYMSAIGNIKNGATYKYLVPIVLGEVKISPNYNHMRLLAAWAIQTPLRSNYSLGHDLFWPIMADYTLPLSLRITAYEYLIHNAKSIVDVLRIESFMANENSKHFCHYHRSIIQSLAVSSDPSDAELREYALQILNFIDTPEKISENISTSQSYGAVDDNGNGFKFRYSVIYNEEKNIIEQFYAEQTFFKGHRTVISWGLYLNVAGIDNLLRYLNADLLKLKETINQAFVFELIDKLLVALATMPDSHVDVILEYRRQCVLSNYYDAQSWNNLKNDIDNVLKAYETPSNVATSKISNQITSYYHVFSPDRYEKFFNVMGIPFSYQHSSITVFKVSKNDSKEVNSAVTGIDIKMWLAHESSISVYEPCTDAWHFAGQTSIVVAHASLETNVYSSPALEFLKMGYPKYYDIEFTGADVMIIDKKSVASIDNNNANSLSPHSIDNREVIVTKDDNTPKNTTITLNHNNEYEWKIISPECENEAGVISSDEWIRSWENNYKFDSFPISHQLENCGYFVHIKPIKKITAFHFL